ncbi:hypothetical protein BG005_003757 [Podila minutissima]|nr:hypothetical protein BG005_003757 [Podila minutissima]
MDWLVLTEAAAEAVSQVLVIIACGAFLSKTGYLSQSAQKSISQVNLYFMTPCLLFTKTVATINWEQFKAFWLIPVFFSIFTAVSWLVAKAGSRWLRFSPDETKFVIAAVLFSNTNSLPMALVQSLVMSAAGLRLLRDEHDTPEQATARGISYILFYAIFANLVRWSYGFNLLVPRSDNSNNASLEEENQTLIIGFDNATLSPGAVWETSGYRRGTRSWLKKAASTVHSRVRDFLTPPLLTTLVALVIGIVPALHRLFTSPSSRVYAFVIHPIENCGAAAIPMILLCLGAQAAHFATTGNTLSTGWSSVAGAWLAQRRRQSGRTQLRNTQYRSQTWEPSSYAIGEDESQDEEDDEGQEMSSIDAAVGQDWFRVPSRSKHMRGGYDCGSAVSMDDAASTTTTLFQFDRPSNAFDGEEDEDDDDGPEPSSSSELPRAHRFWWVSPVSFALLARMILVPALCLPSILFHPGSLSPMLSLDPTFSLTLVLLGAAPTAINMIQLCQLKGFFEQEMAALLSWSYCIWGIPCVLGWSLVGLWAAGR